VFNNRAEVAFQDITGQAAAFAAQYGRYRSQFALLMSHFSAFLHAFSTPPRTANSHNPLMTNKLREMVQSLPWLGLL
jgi:hypothetical protein